MSMEELGRRAVACKHWRWMPGMRLAGIYRSWRVIHVDSDWISFDDASGSGMGCHPDKAKAVDLTDPATLGCLLALVREAHGEDRAANILHGVLCSWDMDAPEFVEALVAALEAAP